jgi:hypothetical protein
MFSVTYNSISTKLTSMNTAISGYLKEVAQW